MYSRAPVKCWPPESARVSRVSKEEVSHLAHVTGRCHKLTSLVSSVRRRGEHIT